jgi:aminopeptidase YwaD
MADTLASESMHGRGYVKRGDEIAAGFIRSEFLKLGAKTFGEDYYQRFNFPVNTFPGAISISTAQKKLEPGKDFIVDPGCPSVNGTFDVIRIGSKELLHQKRLKKKLKRELTSKILVVNVEGKEEKKKIDELLASLNTYPAAVFSTVEKLTWGVSQQVSPYPEIEITKDALSATDEKITIHIENEFVKEYATQNVIGYIPGSGRPE